MKKRKTKNYNKIQDTRYAKQLMSGVKAIFAKIKGIGISKYEMKIEIFKETKKWQQSPYIHSIVTFESYLRICTCYAIWVAINFPVIWSITYAYTAGCAHAYIQMCIDEGMSPYTIAQYRCALAKLYNVPGPMIHDNIPPRLSKNITKNRTYTYDDFLHALEINENNDIIWIGYMTGCRRCEIMTLTKNCFRYKADGSIWLHLHGKRNNTKGGKTRDVYILPKHYSRLKSILKKYKKHEPLYPKKHPKGVAWHCLRQMYAADYYNSIARKYISKDERMINPDRNKHNVVPAVYKKRDGRKYDRRAMYIVSKSLGHNRVNVIAINYTRFFIPMEDNL